MAGATSGKQKGRNPDGSRPFVYRLAESVQPNSLTISGTALNKSSTNQ